VSNEYSSSKDTDATTGYLPVEVAFYRYISKVYAHFFTFQAGEYFRCLQYNPTEAHTCRQKGIRLLTTAQQSHTRVVSRDKESFEEDKLEILALLKFARRPMSAAEISSANDLSMGRTNRLLDSLIASKDIKTTLEGAKIVFVLA
jgi:hypothetical protein